ncbi:MAG: phenylalanine--tRNA ligase subunit alpha, partial [Phycisphaerae bacterium]|nr:phenylalanine--tRNA ligase subunit alpha [Phycisphaerae bacterium]
MSLLEELQQLKSQAEAELAGVGSIEEMEAFRIKYLGSKGAIKSAMKALKDIPKEDKPAAGQAANELKEALQAAYDARAARLAAKAPREKGPKIDVTLPGKKPQIGHTHIITQTINEICEIFGRMGFTVTTGPEVEDEWH